MNNLETIHGTVKINNVDCGFTLENFMLKVELQSGINLNINKLGKREDLPFSMLEGNIHNQAKIILMYFETNGYGFNFVYKHLSTENLVIPVKYYLILEDLFDGKNLSIKYINDSFEKWLGLYPVHKFENVEDKVTDLVTLSYKPCEYKEKFTLSNKEYEIHPNVSTRGNLFSFNHRVCLEVNCLNAIEVEEIFNISKLVMRMVAYSFYRSSISLGDIEIFKKKDGVSSRVGTFYFNYNEKEIEPIDLNKLNDYGFILWNKLYKIIPSLMALLGSNEIFILNLPERRKDRFRCSVVDIPKDAAAFEYEFNKTFPDFKTSNLTDETHISLHEKIWNIDLTKDEKSLLHATDYLFQISSLKEKAMYALNEFGEIVDGYTKNLCHEEIANLFRKARNDVDHGNIDLNISQDTAMAFYAIKIVIMCMQLKRMDVAKDAMDEIIRPVFSFEYNK